MPSLPHPIELPQCAISLDAQFFLWLCCITEIALKFTFLRKRYSGSITVVLGTFLILFMTIEVWFVGLRNFSAFVFHAWYNYIDPRFEGV